MPIYNFQNYQPQVHPLAWIAPNAAVIGQVSIASEVSIWFGAVIRADMAEINIGEQSNIQDNCVLHVDEDTPMSIARRVLIGHGVVLHGCEIGEGTMVGIGSVILNRAKIGKNCIIGARTLVGENKIVPDNSFVVGTPAKILKTVTAENILRVQDGIDNYIKISKQYKNI